jgi:hypothetical protein
MALDQKKYDEKFATLAKALASDIDLLAVAELWVIGDTPDEIAESLKRIAKSGKMLSIAKPGITLTITYDHAGNGKADG